MKKLNIEYSARHKDWFYSIADVVEFLTGEPEPLEYLKVVRQKDVGLDKYLNENKYGIDLYLKNPKRIETVPAIMTNGVLKLLDIIDTPKSVEIKNTLAVDKAKRVVDMFRPERDSFKGTDFLRAKGFSEEWISKNKKADR